MLSAPIDSTFVRQTFNKPANLLAADFIYREIAARMLERLQLVRLDPECVVDAGTGRGADVSILQSHYPKAHVVGLDGSELMLMHAFKEQVAAASSTQKMLLKWLFFDGVSSNLHWVNGDFSQMPLAELSSDLVWSNLALHWHPEPDVVFKEWRRILRVNGLLMFSCFGPDSLKEIRSAFEDEVRPAPHTLPFVDMHDFGDMLVNAGFSTPVMDMEVITLTYATVDQLLAEVRAMGGNPLRTKSKGLLGKSAWHAMRARLEGMRLADGRIPLTLEVIYGHAFKPIPSTKKLGESVIQFTNLRK